MQYRTARKSLRHTGLLPVVSIDGALHRIAVMTDDAGVPHFVETLGWSVVTLDPEAPIFFTRRRAENAAMRLGLTAWVNRSAARLGLVTGQTFAEYAMQEGRFETVGEKKGLTPAQIVAAFAQSQAA